jgi:hypothetical protein
MHIGYMQLIQINLSLWIKNNLRNLKMFKQYFIAVILTRSKPWNYTLEGQDIYSAQFLKPSVCVTLLFGYLQWNKTNLTLTVGTKFWVTNQCDQ